ncbi:GGDEF domain-containing protein [Roseibium sp. SCP14]|uniref:GGDEF domain-containing protein n=1 Tax=Roseibium sp. SCP14 TaxID=3141375 RepID=UPI00333821E3
MELILSVPAVLLCLSTVYVFFLLVVSAALRSNFQSTYLRFWAFTFWAPAVGGVLIVLRPYGPDWMSEYAGCMLFLVGLSSAWLGVRSFFGRRPPWFFTFAVVLGLLPVGVAYDQSVETMALNRQLYIFSAAALFYALAAVEMYRGKAGEALPGRRAGVLVFTSFAILHLAVLPFPVWMPIDFTDMLPVSSWLYVLIVLSLLHTVAAVFVCLLLAKERAEAKVQVMADTDVLTGLNNRRAFIRRVDEQLKDPECGKGTLLLLDLDHFKRINDRHGHQGGDKVLVAFADFLKSFAGRNAVLGRIGGEEFAVFIRGRVGEELDLLAQKVCLGASILRIDPGAADIAFTTSAGLTDTKVSGKAFERLYDHADKALYRAKRSGRNQACRYKKPTRHRVRPTDQESSDVRLSA